MSAAEVVRRLVVGSRLSIAGTVYGTIVVLGAIATGAPHSSPAELAAIVAVLVLVLWVAHFYSHALGESIDRGRRMDRHELVSVARRELAIPLAAVAPIIALVLGAAGVFRESRAIWLAFGLGVLTLAIQGVRYARIERLGPVGTVISVTINLAIGLAIGVLKVTVGH